jgi:hypothetical protein
MSSSRFRSSRWRERIGGDDDDDTDADADHVAAMCRIPMRPVAQQDLWRNVRHRVFSRTPTGECSAAWIGALVYFVRRRPRVGNGDARRLRRVCPRHALRYVLSEPSRWAGAEDTAARSRAVLLLVAIDGSATAAELCAAHDWLSDRPADHASVALVRHAVRTWTDRGIIAAPSLPSLPDAPSVVVFAPPPRFDPFDATALRFFDDTR